jgi:hypothetical protein
MLVPPIFPAVHSINLYFSPSDTTFIHTHIKYNNKAPQYDSYALHIQGYACW